MVVITAEARMATHMTPEQVERCLELIRGAGECIARGRAGEGFAYRDGQYFRVYVEDFDRQDTPVTEGQLRAALASLDLESYGNRYEIWALNGIGAALPEPKFSV